MAIIIIKSDFHERHSTGWSHEWLKICKERNFDARLIDWREFGIFETIVPGDIVLWHFNHYSSGEMLFARTILYRLKEKGCRVYPDFNDSWHFDDKVAQTYLFDALNIPSPRNDVLFSEEAVEAWIERIGTFPVVAKLKAGSGSSNVRLINSAGALRDYARTSFGRGFDASPGVSFKIASNLKSSRSLSEIWSRAKRAPEFLFSLMQARALPKEKGYVYLQEFIPDCSYDIKIVIVGDKMSFLGRRIRGDDFRASGGADSFTDKNIITPRIVNAAFASSDAMKSVCTGFDVVVDGRTEEPYVVEVSYGFSHISLMHSGGHFDRKGNWHDEPLNAPSEILDLLMASDPS